MKDRTAVRLLRFILTIGLAVVLAVVFIKMIMPNSEQDTPAPPPDTGKTVALKRTAEVQPDGPPDAETGAPGPTGEVVRMYRGEGAEPVDDPTLTWKITLEISDQTLRLLEGNVLVREFTGELPASDLVFSITPTRYLITLTESGSVTARLDGAYDPAAAALFSVNDESQFYIYLTPKKLRLPSKAVPSRFLIEREDSPLIAMQGFIRTDNRIIGTFHSVFGPDIEYILEPLTAE